MPRKETVRIPRPRSWYCSFGASSPSPSLNCKYFGKVGIVLVPVSTTSSSSLYGSPGFRIVILEEGRESSGRDESSLAGGGSSIEVAVTHMHIMPTKKPPAE